MKALIGSYVRTLVVLGLASPSGTKTVEIDVTCKVIDMNHNSVNTGLRDEVLLDCEEEIGWLEQAPPKQTLIFWTRDWYEK